jgi:hypothetical protein
MSAQENKALVLRLVEEFHRGNLAFVDEVFSPNVRLITPSPDWVFPDGLEGARMMFGLMHEMGAKLKIEDIIAEDDTVAVRWTLTGVYRGEPKPGFPKAGRENDFWISILLPICERQDRPRLRPRHYLADPRSVEIKLGHRAPNLGRTVQGFNFFG